MAQTPSPVSAAAIEPNDRVFITNEDSNTIGGIVPPHAAMTARPLYHGAINVHGLVPSLDSRWLATTARGSSNVYVIDTLARKVLGGGVNPQAVGRRRRRGSHRDRRRDQPLRARVPRADPAG
jgi:DNA-binding beta-propeller fold protein YncE